MTRMRLSSMVVPLFLSTWLAAVSGLAQQRGYIIDTYAGTDETGDGGAAYSARLRSVEGLAADRSGNIYIADSLNHRVRRIDAVTGVISTLAGTGQAGYAGDGGPAARAQLNSPYGLAVDRGNNVFVADFGNSRVRKISAGGVIETVCGAQAIPIQLRRPRNVAVDESGNLYIADFADHRIYRLSSSGEVSIVAGTGTPGFEGDGPALSRPLNSPAGLAVTPDGVVYVADSGNNLVRKISNGYISTVAGGVPGTLELSHPTGLSLDGRGALYIADSGNNRIVRRDPDGRITPVTGSLNRPESVRDVVFHSRLIAGGGSGVYEIQDEGGISLLAGVPGWKSGEDGILASEASLDGPIGLGLDLFGRLLIVEEAGRRVRMAGTSGALLTVAGTGQPGVSGDGGVAVNAALNDPVDVAVDSRGRTWIADYLGNHIRRVSFDGHISTAAGDGSPGFAGDGGWASLARLNRPRGLAADPYGGVYIADSRNHCIRLVDAAGKIATVAGNGVRGYCGDFGLAELASLDSPAAVAISSGGSLYIADTGNNVIREVRPDGVIRTVAGTGAAGFGGDGGPAVQGALDRPAGVALDGDGNLVIADTGNHRVRLVGRDGILWTIAGTGDPGFVGDGLHAVDARLHTPSAVAAAADGTIYVADLGNNRIRRLQPVLGAPATDAPQHCEIVHAATYRSGPLAPGQLASIFGANVGGGEVDEVTVTFEEIPATLLYVGPDQINVQVPYEAAGRETTHIEVLQYGHVLASAEAMLAPAVPGLFARQSGAGEAIALNEDGSSNTAGNPASPGSDRCSVRDRRGPQGPAVATAPSGKHSHCRTTRRCLVCRRRAGVSGAHAVERPPPGSLPAVGQPTGRTLHRKMEEPEWRNGCGSLTAKAKP